MKKIVGILGMAAVLASGAFAAQPEAKFVLADFSGSAEFGWKADFADSNNAKIGMFNETSTAIKFGLITEGTRETTGDGIWGDLQIKFADGRNWQWDSPDHTAGTIPALSAPSVEVAKIHFVDGDFSAALNIAKPTLKYDKWSPAAAAGGVTGKWDGDNAAANRAKVAAAAKLHLEADKTAVKNAQTAYDEAVKLGTNAGDIATKNATLVAAKATLAQTEKDIAAAAPAAPAATPEIGDETGLAAGFGLELAMDKMFALNVKLMDASLVKAADQKFGLAFDVALKAIENLDASVAASFNFDKKYTGMMAKAGYKFAINDTLYVKPAAAYSFNKTGDAEGANHINGGVLFGWGAADLEPGLDFIPNKTTEGVSVTFDTTAKKDAATSINVGLYDESLFKFLGLEDFGTLKTGVVAEMALLDSKVNGVVAAAVKYDVTLDPIYVALHGGMRTGFGDANKDTYKAEFAYGAKIGSKAIVDNTDVYVSYEGGMADSKVTANNVTIGTKISF